MHFSHQREDTGEEDGIDSSGTSTKFFPSCIVLLQIIFGDNAIYNLHYKVKAWKSVTLNHSWIWRFLVQIPLIHSTRL